MRTYSMALVAHHWTHLGLPLQRSHLRALPVVGLAVMAPTGQAWMQSRQPVHFSSSSSTPPPSSLRMAAQHNIAALKASTAKRIVASCPACYYTLKVEYPRVGSFNMDVVHATQLFRDFLEEGKIAFKRGLKGMRSLS